MADNFIEVIKDNNIAVITVNNPPLNILIAPVMEQLAAAFKDVAADNQVRAVILTAAGTTFIAGANIKEIAMIVTPEDGQRLAEKGQEMFRFIENMNKPVIAAVNGVCFGGGMEMIMACHIRIACERARFSQPEINLGIIPGFGGTQRLPKIVGTAKAIELILTGYTVSAQEALDIGLVSRVLPELDLIKYAENLAKTIAQKSAQAVGGALRSIRESSSLKDSGYNTEAKEFGTLCNSKDMKEGVSAFLEKRQPNFNQ